RHVRADAAERHARPDDVVPADGRGVMGRVDSIAWRVFVRGAAFVAAVSVLAAAGPAGAGTKLVGTGHGWGHGVGMSQWGAFGYARHGWSWQRILAHYYQGTQISPAPLSRVRVLLAEKQSHARVACAAPMRVNDVSGRGYALPAGVYSFGPGLK